MTTAPSTAGETTTFGELGLASDLEAALTAQGITTPFPIQELTLNLALAGADIIGQARTGTGKTLAFGLPMLQHVDVGDDRVQTLVIVPTRELCLQVAEDLEQAGGVKAVRVLATYGGKSLDPQIDALRRGGVHVVVGTPGRLLDLLRRGVLDLSSVRGLVLDEADEMLDLGFLPDVEQLIEATPQRRQTLLFSATMPSAVVALARRYMQQPTFLRADVEEVHIAPKTEQHFFSCHRMDKPAVLARILQSPNRGLCVVFSRTKRMCDILADELRERGIAAAPIHSDLRQESREKALNRFREGKIDVLVATEVAARGLDIDDVTHVVNYDCPDDEKMYLHRVGRTGRAGAAGVAITLAVWNELARLNMIKRALDIDVETHEVFSTSPILDELFDLPPREERPKPARVRSREGRDREQDGAGGRSRRGKGAAGRSEAGAETRAETGTDAEDGQGPRRPSARQDEGAPAKIRRRSRRRPPAGESEDATSQRRAPSEAAEVDSAEPRIRRRTRTRTGATGGTDATGGGRASAGESRASTEPSRSGAALSDEEPSAAPTRARTRTRTRSSADRPSGDRAGLSGQAEEDAGEVRRTRTRRRRGDEPTSGRRSDAETGDDAGPGDVDARAERGGDGGSKQRKRKGGRKARGKSKRSGERERTPSVSGRAAAPVAALVTTEQARGEGRPRLRRPLEVAHLP